MDMEDLNEAGNGSEDFGAFDDKPLNDRPVSIRDSLKAAIDAAEGYGPGDITGQPRDGENGRFLAKGQEQAAAAARAGQPPAANAAQQTPQAQTQMQTREQPASIGSRVPPGWSAEAKAQFGSLPSEVQAAIAKREQEVDNGFRVLQDYKGLEEFTPLIRQAGMTHADVMRRAIDWEKALIHDPVNTVVHVARMAGVNLHASSMVRWGRSCSAIRSRPDHSKEGRSLDPSMSRQRSNTFSGKGTPKLKSMPSFPTRQTRTPMMCWTT